MVEVVNVFSKKCWEELTQNETSLLVDVRTQAEWMFVGVPDLSSIRKKPLFVSWKEPPTSPPAPDFVEKLSALIENKAQPIYFLCRSGQRSHAAACAMMAAGFSACFNVADGFEGDLDEQHHRGQKSGWKMADLPWKQS